jgi:hypothetical protein
MNDMISEEDRSLQGMQPQPDPLVTAMGKMLVAALNREAGLEVRIIILERRVAELESK